MNINKIFKTFEADAIYITSPENMLYLSGFIGEGMLIITEDCYYLFTDARYAGYVNNLKCKNLKYIDVTGIDIYKAVADLVTNLKIKRIAFENYSCKYKDYKNLINLYLTLIPLNDEINDLRSFKKSSEISNIKKAAEICDKVYSRILNDIKPGIAEKTIAAKINYYMMDFGASGSSFDTIVASGINSSIPHAVPTDKKISLNEFVILDFGCKFKGYCSDMTRTVYIGSASQEEKDIYNSVLYANKKVIKSSVPGMTCKQIDDLARIYLTKKGMGKYFVHSTGHGVGILVHELPYISQKSDSVVTKNMIFSVEPGVYYPDNFGIRIEDLVLMTDNGITVLSESNKEFTEIF